MRLPSVFSALLLTSLCLAAPKQSQSQIDTGNNTSQSDLIRDIFDVAVDSVFKTVVNATGDCECVPYYQCRNGWIVDDGSEIFDARTSTLHRRKARTSRSTFDTCENYLDICCKLRNMTYPEDKMTDPSLKKDKCQKRHPDGDSSLKKGECGRRHTDGVGFGTSADKNHAKFADFPWMVAIAVQKNISVNDTPTTVYVYQCGGALIHRQAVLTSAYCLNGTTSSKLKCRFGEWDTKSESEKLPHQSRNVRKIITHEKFNDKSLHNDFAILILSSPVELAENVDIVCLPEENDRFDGSRCFASGWGKEAFGRYQNVLKSIELPVVPRDACQNSLRQTRLGRRFNLHSSLICAGGETGKDTCLGDGGSPLVCPLSKDSSRYVQAGIVSWGIGCGETGIPGVYANVAAARKWIDEKIACNNLDSASYAY